MGFFRKVVRSALSRERPDIGDKPGDIELLRRGLLFPTLARRVVKAGKLVDQYYKIVPFLLGFSGYVYYSHLKCHKTD